MIFTLTSVIDLISVKSLKDTVELDGPEELFDCKSKESAVDFLVLDGTFFPIL